MEERQEETIEQDIEVQETYEEERGVNGIPDRRW